MNMLYIMANLRHTEKLFSKFVGLYNVEFLSKCCNVNALKYPSKIDPESELFRPAKMEKND